MEPAASTKSLPRSLAKKELAEQAAATAGDDTEWGDDLITVELMPRKETLADGIELYLGDCREILPSLGKVDALSIES
jgi:hypothetical protein